MMNLVVNGAMHAVRGALTIETPTSMDETYARPAIARPVLRDARRDR